LLEPIGTRTHDPVERRGKLQEVRYHSDDEKAGKNKHLVKKKLLSTKLKTAFIKKKKTLDNAKGVIKDV
jgi:hypothetical protein